MNSNPYVAAQTLAKLNCKNCGTSVIVDAQDQQDVQKTAEWIQIVPANGERFAACSRSCALKVIEQLDTPSKIILER